MTGRECIIRCALTEGIGPALIARLISRGPDWALSLAGASVADLMRTFSLTQRHAQAVHTALCADDAYVAHEAWCAENGVRVVAILDAEYPVLLSKISVPPAVLWVKGVFASSRQTSCALVGSRDATFYGKSVVCALVPSLVKAGVATVSGGARGIDRWVHEETLAANGHTTVVLGCGLAHCYPREHIDLFTAVVAKGGCLVSPFPPHTAPSKGLFPARNRIIAGLSSACIVVQAAQKSGALITAAYALEENRDVGAVPGMITEPLSRGCHELIAQGAAVILDGDAACELCGTQPRSDVSIVVEGVSPGAQVVLSALVRPLSVDEVCVTCGYEAPAALAYLFELVARGRVEQDFSGLWVRCG